MGSDDEAAPVSAAATAEPMEEDAPVTASLDIASGSAIPQDAAVADDGDARGRQDEDAAEASPTKTTNAADEVQHEAGAVASSMADQSLDQNFQQVAVQEGVVQIGDDGGAICAAVVSDVSAGAVEVVDEAVASSSSAFAQDDDDGAAEFAETVPPVVNDPLVNDSMRRTIPSHQPSHEAAVVNALSPKPPLAAQAHTQAPTPQLQGSSSMARSPFAAPAALPAAFNQNGSQPGHVQELHSVAGASASNSWQQDSSVDGVNDAAQPTQSYPASLPVIQSSAPTSPVPVVRPAYAEYNPGHHNAQAHTSSVPQPRSSDYEAGGHVGNAEGGLDAYVNGPQNAGESFALLENSLPKDEFVE